MTLFPRKRIQKLVLVLFALGLFAFAAPLHGTVFVHTTSAASDPIAVGNAQYDQYDALIVSLSQQYGLNPFVIKGQIMLESGFNANAVSQQINAGCGYTNDIGLMQINPYCSGISASSLYNPTTNLDVGIADMGHLYQQFGDINLALQAYNIGSTSVAAGARNWAYSNAVENWASTFQNEHNSIYGSSAAPASVSSGSGSYTVQPGDSLYAIGQTFGVSWQSIASANGINSPYIIFAGEHLAIPTGSGSSSSSTYTVQSGDSLYSIGQRYGVSWQNIASANGIYSPYIIYAGQQLKIP